MNNAICRVYKFYRFVFLNAKDAKYAKESGVKVLCSVIAKTAMLRRLSGKFSSLRPLRPWRLKIKHPMAPEIPILCILYCIQP
jgi:hypothetical protein